jgi:hypothetical protein
MRHGFRIYFPWRIMSLAGIGSLGGLDKILAELRFLRLLWRRCLGGEPLLELDGELLGLFVRKL